MLLALPLLQDVMHSKCNLAHLHRFTALYVSFDKLMKHNYNTESDNLGFIEFMGGLGSKPRVPVQPFYLYRPPMLKTCGGSFTHFTHNKRDFLSHHKFKPTITAFHVYCFVFSVRMLD